MAEDLIASRLLQEHGEILRESRELHPFNADQVEALYDPYNRRLKLFELTPAAIRNSSLVASAIACDQPNPLYSKIIVYAAPDAQLAEFGLRQEAIIRGFFADNADAQLWCAYPDPERAIEKDRDANERGLAIAQSKPVSKPVLPPGYTSRPADEDDAKAIAQLLLRTFDDYPVPITPERIRKLMQDGSLHFRLIHDTQGELAAAASAEISLRRKSAELTDCATRPDQRGKGLMTVILADLESDLHTRFKITNVYTIARALEVGMNCSFAKLGFAYTGRLVNNCRMPNGWESMNVWCHSAQG